MVPSSKKKVEAGREGGYMDPVPVTKICCPVYRAMFRTRDGVPPADQLFRFVPITGGMTGRTRALITAGLLALLLLLFALL
jgi:hypothetical protein